MPVECAIDGVAGIGADSRAVWLDLVGDVEAVDVHESAFDTQIGINQLVQVDLNFEVSSFDPIDGVRAWAERVQLIQLFTTDGMGLVAERVLDGFDAACEVHLCQVESNERVRLESRRINNPAADERHWEGRREAGRR